MPMSGLDLTSLLGLSSFSWELYVVSGFSQPPPRRRG